MMTEHVKRFLSMLVEALLGPARRLAWLGRRAPRVESKSPAYEEADSLEASGKPAKQTARETTASGADAHHRDGASGRPHAGAGAGGRRQSPPFRAGAACAGGAWPLSRPAGERTATTGYPWPRRRGRPPGSKKNRTKAVGGYQAGSGGSLPGTTPTRSDIIMGRKRLSSPPGGAQSA